MSLKLSKAQEWAAAVPAGSFVATVINDNGSYRVRKVDPSRIGAVGPKGDTGATIYSSAAAPVASSGNNGDFHIDTATGNLYKKESGSWTLIGNLRGPQGTQGDQGIQGPAGTAGADGADAVPAGSSGNVQFHDGGTPAALAADAAFSYDSTNDELSVDNVKLGVKTESYAATVTLDFREEGLRILSVTGDVLFASSNLAAGRSLAIRLTDDGSGRAVSFPAGWTFVGTKPANLTASKVSVLSLTSFSTTDANVVAAWSEEA